MASSRTASKFAAAYQNLLESYGLTEQEALVIVVAGFMFGDGCRVLCVVNDISERNGTIKQSVTLNTEEWKSETSMTFRLEEDEE